MARRDIMMAAQKAHRPWRPRKGYWGQRVQMDGSHHALFPPGKGRIERLFGTLQDRLVKERMLKGIRTLEGANRFLDGHDIREFNRKLSLEAFNKEDLHRPIPQGMNVEAVA